MSVVKKYQFPMRMNAEDLPRMYDSLEHAFSEHDFAYVSRFGKDAPELHGCALLMLGNRTGGEHILDRDNVTTARSYLYRAFAAWQHDQTDEAKQWLAKARELGSKDVRLDRLSELINRQSFRIVFHIDFHGESTINTFKNLPNFEVIITRHGDNPDHHSLLPGENIAMAVPAGAPIDLVIIDDLKYIPVGVGYLGAPVVAVAHDIEWYYDYLSHIMPEVDLAFVGSTLEAMELGRNFGIKSDVSFFPLHITTPEKFNLEEEFSDTKRRTTDVLYTGAVVRDIYRYKKQVALSLAFLPDKFKIKIDDMFYPWDEFWEVMRQSRFSLTCFRTCNNLSTRALEAITCGAFHLVDEESGFPYLFSQHFNCFPVYRRAHCREDVEQHLSNYETILTKFQSELPQFKIEFENLFPADDKIRATRFLRHLLYMTHVEDNERRWIERKNLKPLRQTVFMNALHRGVPASTPVAQKFTEQSAAPHWLRKAFAFRSQQFIEGVNDQEAYTTLRNSASAILQKTPNSLVVYYTLGICEMKLGNFDKADQYFSEITSRELTVSPDDPPPSELDHVDSMYWLEDALIRENCPKDLHQLTTTANVWKSFAWAQRAEIAVNAAAQNESKNKSKDAQKDYEKSATHAQRSLELFPYNEFVQKIFLRASFGLAKTGDTKWGNEFLQSFEAARHNDQTTLHDFAAPAIHILATHGKTAGALNVLNDLRTYLQRANIQKRHYKLYPEFVSFIQKYGVPNTHMPDGHIPSGSSLEINGKANTQSKTSTPEFTNPQFFALIIALIKEARFGDAIRHILERRKTHLDSSRLFSFQGLVSATAGQPKDAATNFLAAYANSRNPFYLRQLEDLLPQIYEAPVPVVLDSLDFVSFFKNRGAKIDAVDFKNVPRITPLLAGQPSGVYPSTLFEEMMTDRGLWIAEDKDIEVIYAKQHHSSLIGKSGFLVEKAHEFPFSDNSPAPLFPAYATAMGSTGIISLHSSTRSVLCRKELLPVKSFDEEGVFIGGLPNTGHHLLDYLPKLETWAQTRGSKDIPIYICHFSDFYHEMSSTLFPEFRFINIASECAEPTLLHFKHLHVPSYVPASFGFSALRERAKRFGLMKDNGKDKMIYLARGKKHRRLLNESELTERLEKIGFTIVDTMQASFTELLEYIASADIIVTGVGAQNSYIPFCIPGTEYIDIMPDTYIDDEGWQFNERLYTYSRVKLQKVRGMTDNSDPIAAKYNWLYTCNVKEVEDAITASAARMNIQLN